jgi:ABC-2 type transport system ATP-binding protein
MYESTVQHTNNHREIAVLAEGLGKRYGDLWALREVDLEVPTGSVLGLLGHNGAGKTTAVRIFTTLAVPTAGRARVAGLDVVADPARVRASIGLTGQYASVDDLMTARANLEMVGLLYHLPRAIARKRADELLERLGLADAADRLVKTYSGGMRRRVDLAASLIASPPVLFLDEPTTGLDPESRSEIWALLGELVGDGTTLILTTQYLDEADRTADQIVVLGHGRISAQGTPYELKQRVGGERVAITLGSEDRVDVVANALNPFADGEIAADPAESEVVAPVRRGTRLIEIVRALDAAGVDATDVHRREATLDDVFLTITRNQTQPHPQEAHPR